MTEDPRNVARRWQQFAKLSLRQKVLHLGRRRKRLLFGRRPEWAHFIRSRIDHLRYEYCSGDFKDFDLTRFDAVVPMRLEDYTILNALGEKARRLALFPEPKAVDLCDNKADFNRVMLASPFSDLIPTVYTPPDFEFPLIVKKKRDEFGKNSHVLYSNDHIKIAKFLNDEYFFQEAVPGNKEYTTHILLRDGKIKYFSVVRYEMEHEICINGHTSNSKRYFVGEDDQFLSVFADIMKYIGYNDGACCINYKVKNGTPKIFEINPRYGASLTENINQYLDAYLSALPT